MVRAQRYQLSDAMLKRLAQCADEYKEPGAPDDVTRLISKWPGATDYERKQLEDRVKAHLEDDLSCSNSITAVRLQEAEPNLWGAVCTTKVLNQEITNTKRRLERAANCKL